jgi:molybdopterin/thiamine biosynthesis adenylyltransferase
MSGNAGDRDRHSRSRLFPGLGDEGMARIRRSSFAIVGVGAVGAAAAEMAVRAGVPRLTLVDRDVVELSNLSRQFLFDERDAEAVAPKAVAAARRLSEIDRSAEVRGIVADLSHGNALDLLSGNNVLVDASDNFETRLLVSDTARFLGAISVYAACVGEEGLVSVSMPGSPCLRCYLEELPAAGTGQTCDTAGVVPTLPPTVAGIAMTETLRAVAGAPVSGGVLSIRAWNGPWRARRLFEQARPSPRCPACREDRSARRFPALQGEGASEVVKLCGRQAVQVAPASRERPDLAALERRLERVARVRRSEHLLAADVEDVSLTIFSDGRCVVRGTGDPLRARSLYERYVGR